MSIQNLQAFRKKVEGDPSLQPAILRNAQAGNLMEIVNLGKKHGFEFTEKDIDEVFGPGRSAELSEFELELVTAAASVQKC